MMKVRPATVSTLLFKKIVKIIKIMIEIAGIVEIRGIIAIVFLPEITFSAMPEAFHDKISGQKDSKTLNSQMFVEKSSR